VKYWANAPITSWLVLASSLVVCFGLWQWADHVLAPASTARAVAQGRPIGNNSDLYPAWLTAREVLLWGKHPYTAELTAEIQRGFYGRELDPRNSSDPKNVQAFVYPLYVVFLLAPTVNLPFSAVAQACHWLSLVSIASSVPLWMYAIGFRPRSLFTVSAMVLSVSNFPAVLESRQHNLSALALLLLAGGMAATVRHWFVLSGFLLALSTIKPQLSGLLILWTLLWAVSDWTKRGRVVWSFASTFLTLIAGATAISPHWMTGFWTAARLYRSYGWGPSVFQAMLPPVLAIPVMALLVLVVGIVGWKSRRTQPGSTQFAWTLALLVTVTVTLATQAAHYQPLLIPALLVLVASIDAICKSGFLVRTLAKGTFACLFWQWGTAFGLAICSMFLPVSRLRTAAELPMYTLLALPILTLLVVGAAFSTRLPWEIIRSSESAVALPRVS
jgi:hypothetical protein